MDNVQHILGYSTGVWQSARRSVLWFRVELAEHVDVLVGERQCLL